MLRILGIYDEDTDYARRLSTVLSARITDPVRVVTFTQKESLQNFHIREPLDLLLINAGSELQEGLAAEGIPLCRLSPRIEETSDKGLPVIFKYQPVSAILEAVLDLLQMTPSQKSSTIIKGRLSPLGAEACLATLDDSGPDRLVVFWDMLVSEEGLTGMWEWEEAIFSLRCKRLKERWKKAEEEGPLTSLWPAEGLSLYSESNAREMAEVIREIAGWGRYEEILIIFGQVWQDPGPLLELCDDLVVLSVAAKKEKGRERRLMQGLIRRLPHLADRIRRESLTWKEFTDYATQ